MTNGEYVTKIVEQDEDFCILTDDVAETVTIEVSLDWWNKPKTDVLAKIRAEIDRQEKWLLQAGCTAYNVDIALDAIKAVVKEKE